MKLAFLSPCRPLQVLTLAAAMACGGCAKDDAGTSSFFVNFGPGEGIDYRTGNNQPVGSADATDWTLDDKWSATEQRLFATLPLSLNAEPQGLSQRNRISFGGYPNPAVNQLNFFYTAPVAVSCRYVVVDNLFRVIFENSTSAPATQTTFSLNLTKSARIKTGQRYRIYYVLYTGTTLYYKGHGDFKVVEP